MNKAVFRQLLCLMCLVLTVSGCTSTGIKNPSGIAPRVVDPNQQSLGAGTGIESQDMIQVTDKMARSILAIPEIANAAEPPIIALYPVTNDTRFPINAEIFTARIKASLNSKCLGKVRFISRDPSKENAGDPTRVPGSDVTRAVERERMLKDSGMVTSSKSAPMAGADYFLTGKLIGMSQAASTGRSDYIMYSFSLIDAETTIEVWEDFAEIKKEGLEDAIYR